MEFTFFELWAQSNWLVYQPRQSLLGDYSALHMTRHNMDGKRCTLSYAILRRFAKCNVNVILVILLFSFLKDHFIKFREKWSV